VLGTGADDSLASDEQRVSMLARIKAEAEKHFDAMLAGIGMELQHDAARAPHRALLP
jgi:hypothetical protein